MKWVVIVLVALTMAEFVALDMAMFIASDIILYVELIVAGWAFSALAFLHPAIGYRLTMLGSRILTDGSESDRQSAKKPEDEPTVSAS
jgi:membrane protein implicated in regulation of membrane protease activity